MADPLDILTLDEAKQSLSIDLTDLAADQGPLPRYVTAVSRLLDSRIGPTVQRTITGEEHHDTCGRCTVVLRHRPVSAVAAVTEYRDTTGTALAAMSLTSHPADGFRFGAYEPQAGLYDGIMVRTAGDRTTTFQGPVAVTYTAGRAASTTSVDARIKHAATICLENLWRDRQQTVGQFGEFDVPIASFPTFALPRAAADLLAEELGQNEPWGLA